DKQHGHRMGNRKGSQSVTDAPLSLGLIGPHGEPALSGLSFNPSRGSPANRVVFGHAENTLTTVCLCVTAGSFGRRSIIRQTPTKRKLHLRNTCRNLSPAST